MGSHLSTVKPGQLRSTFETCSLPAQLQPISSPQLKMKICILSLNIVLVALLVLFKLDTRATILFPHQFEELKNSKLNNSTSGEELNNSTAEIPVTSDESKIWDVRPEDYPETLIKNILERNNSLISYFLKSSEECSNCVDTRLLLETDEGDSKYKGCLFNYIPHLRASMYQ